MKKRLMARETSARAWRDTAEFTAKYTAAKAEAQARADATGRDVGIEVFDGTDARIRAVRVFMLPNKENRYGHETTCEVVSCSTLSRCAKGHGP